MKKAGVKSRLIESDELSELTKQGVQRAMEARMTQLTVDEIDEVSGGVLLTATSRWGVADIPLTLEIPLGPICNFARSFPCGQWDPDMFTNFVSINIPRRGSR